MANTDVKVAVTCDTRITQAVLELTNAQTVIEQLDVKANRNNLMNLLAVGNSINMVIKLLTAPEKGETDGNTN